MRCISLVADSVRGPSLLPSAPSLAELIPLSIRRCSRNNGWRETQKKGISEQVFLKAANYAGRDNARTPMQWKGQLHGGFSEVEPWIKVNENVADINVEDQQFLSNSILGYFKAMTSFRKANRVLTYGDYQPLEEASDRLFLYLREGGKEKLLIVLNFSDQVINLPDLLVAKINERLIGNYEAAGSQQQVRAWEAIVYRYGI